LAESLQAYACATRQFLGKDLIDVSQITDKTTSDADCDRTLKQAMAGLDEQWFYTVVKTANKIFEDVPGAKSGKQYKFYRGGTFVDSITMLGENINKVVELQVMTNGILLTFG
jgi:hypothetical protein